MLNALPLIVSSIAGSFRAIGKAKGAADADLAEVERPRTDRDIPMPMVFLAPRPDRGDRGVALDPNRRARADRGAVLSSCSVSCS